MNEDPFDKTIWDPFDPELAIEDSMHGPTATFKKLQEPTMPLGNGIYYQSGHGMHNPYFDSLGREVRHITIGLPSVSANQMTNLCIEWTQAYVEGGDEALEQLETRRQNERLDKTGFAHCFKPSDMCPGGKRLEDCDTGGKAYDAAQTWFADETAPKNKEGTFSTVLYGAGRKCVSCAVSCEVSATTVNGEPDVTRVTFYTRDPTMQAINIDTEAYWGNNVSNLSELSSMNEALKRIIEIPNSNTTETNEIDPNGQTDKIQQAKAFYEGMKTVSQFIAGIGDF